MPQANPDIELSFAAHERALIRKYGYPFEEMMQQLVAAEHVRGKVVLKAPQYYWELIAGDLARSSNHGEIGSKDEEMWVDEIFERVEWALAQHVRRTRSS